MKNSVFVLACLFLIFLVFAVDSPIEAGTCDCMCTGNFCSGSGPMDTCSFMDPDAITCALRNGTCDGSVTISACGFTY